MTNIVLYKDVNNNLWLYEGYEADIKMHKVIVVDEDDGYYTNTNITCYLTEEEFAQCTEVHINIQATLEEILDNFKDFSVYGLHDNAELYVVDTDNKVVLYFESIGYEDDDCVPTVYEETPCSEIGKDFDDIYPFDNIAITKMNSKKGGTK